MRVPPGRVLLTLALSFAGSLLPADGSNGKLLKPDEVEAFLRDAKVLDSKYLNVGITGTQRVKLTHGGRVHYAHVQTIDESRTTYQTALGTELNFRDSWKFNIAAYRLDRMLNLNMTPPSVERRWNGKEAAFTWWIGDGMMEGERKKKKLEPPDADRFNAQMYVVRVFDQLVFNTDRNLQNLLITPDWSLWMIDHTRAFRIRKDLSSPKNLVKCDRTLLEKLRSLTRERLKEQLSDCLRANEIDAILARRDKIVALFDKRVAAQGKDHVLYDRPSRQAGWILPAEPITSRR